jgi:DNA-binding transcriptional LysR family regulator
MRLRHIEVFHAIYISGSITGAAELLYVSQPSVSKVLSHAEQQLGFPLFHRNKGKLTPTAEAEIMFPEIKRIYQQLKTVRHLAGNIGNGATGIINLAVTPALGFDVLPEAIAKFRSKYPNVAFNLKTVHNQEALQSLLEYKCDLAVLFSSPALPGVREITITEQEMVVMYPESRFPDRPISLSLDELVEEDIIGIWESGPLGEMASKRIDSAGIELRSSIQVDTYYIAARLVDAGLGCCIIDRATARGNLSPNTAMATFTPALSFSVKALHLENRPLSKMAEAFLLDLRASIDTHL